MATSSSLGTGIIGGIIGTLAVLLFVNHYPNVWRNVAPAVTIPGTSTAPAQQPNATLGGEEAQTVATVKKASPAVVSIIITKDVPVIEQYFGQNPQSPFDNFFSPFQFQVPQLRQNGTQKQEVGGGSGFLISADGKIVTNKHVVADAQAEYTVFTTDGQKYTAKVLARDPVNDIAMIKIDGNNFPYLSFGDSDHLEVGQRAIAIGNALSEFQNTVSVGVISGLSRSITAGDGSGQSEQLDHVIQTDAAINPGNSGGPLLNSAGQVIGVNVAVALGSENIGFALPANLVTSVVDSVEKTGTIVRPFIGVRYVEITPEIKEENKLTVDQGIIVMRGADPSELAVVPGSPAAKAGIVENDIITEADGKPLDDKNTLTSVIRAKKVGDTVRLKVIHSGQAKEVTLTLEALPA